MMDRPVFLVALLQLLAWRVCAEHRGLQTAAGLRRGLQSLICDTVDSCGPSCIPCTFKPNDGIATCVLQQQAGVYQCDYVCNKGFVKAIIKGRAGCKRATKPAPKKTTGLTYTVKGVGASQQTQLKWYNGLQDRASRTRNAGASTPEQLKQAACGITSKDCLDYAEVLLLTLMPTAYSSNNTADTGGYAYISPAQDQGKCSACVGFVATAAAEAAVNVYMKQNWDNIGLSEQDVSFCKFFPTKVNCVAGSSYDSLIFNVGNALGTGPNRPPGNLQQWASRDCYPYKAAAEPNCKQCASDLPQDGMLSMAYEGNALPSIAFVKEHIMLFGGVMTSISVPPDFDKYSPTPSKDVYNSSVQRSTPELHAVFCYGWNDTGGWFICKNSWGTSWGLQGSFKIAYGAASVMPPDYTFALQFGPTNKAEQLRSEFTNVNKIGLDPEDAGCVLYFPEQPMRVAYLQHAIHFLAASSPASSISKAEILEDLLLSNVGLSDLVGPSSGPFRVCGRARDAMLEPIPSTLEFVLLNDTNYPGNNLNDGCTQTAASFEECRDWCYNHSCRIFSYASRTDAACPGGCWLKATAAMQDKQKAPGYISGLKTDWGFWDPEPRGWFDADCDGRVNDYCRFVGSDPAAEYWSCSLDGTSNHYTPEGQYMFDTTSREPCRTGN